MISYKYVHQTEQTPSDVHIRTRLIWRQQWVGWYPRYPRRM